MWDRMTENGRREAILLFLATLFTATNTAILSFSGGSWWPWLVWLGGVWLAFALLTRYQPIHDPFLLPIIALLGGWGLILQDRLAPNFLSRQVMWVGVMTAVLLAIAILPHDLRILRRYRTTWLIGGLFLLALTLLLGVNPSGFGAALWLPIGGRIFFQPSELLKLLLVVYLASYFAEQQNLLRLNGERSRLFNALPYLAPLLMMWGFCIVLLVWQRDLGAATLFFVLFVALLYVATGERLYVWSGLGLLLLASVFAYTLFDVVTLRVDAWWNPWPEADNRAFQIVQSLYALAAGGIWGEGAGLGYPTYIPVVHSDFAFAAIAEEWGLIGALSVVACFAFLTYRGLRVAMLAQRPFHTYLAAGITILLATQSLLILGGVTKLLPLTGVTLPFVSYGGSSLLMNGVMMGLLLFLSSRGASDSGG